MPPVKCSCGRPVNGRLLCKPCTTTLERALAETPFLISELDTVITRQTVYASRNDGSRSSSQPLPFHVAAADTKRKIAHKLDYWAAAMISTKHVHDCPASVKPESIARWMTSHIREIPTFNDAQPLHREILEPITKARWLIDRPADRWYAGPCTNDIRVDPLTLRPTKTDEYILRPCGAELYATTGSGDVTCRWCEAVYDVSARRDWLLAAAEDQLAPAATCARAVSWLGGVKVTATLIYVWADRKRIFAKGSEPYPTTKDPGRTRPLYRVGDVIDLAHTTATTTQKGNQ